MRSYSVMIELSGVSKKQIKSRLKATFGSEIARGARVTQAGEIAESFETCRALGHFGCVHWTDEDLKARLEELNVPVTAEVLSKLKVSYSVRHIDDMMVERGWEVIEDSILDAKIQEKHL
jgi:hypothetical protein